MNSQERDPSLVLKRCLFSFLLMLNSQGSGLDVPDADLETDEDLVSASNTRGHCDVQRLADDGRRLP